VWIARLGLDPPRMSELEEYLDSAEQARAARFHRSADRDRFVATRGLLRELLGALLGVEPAAVELTVRDAGKPALARDAGDVRFNVSHSGERAAFAVARSREVGIDVERRREGFDAERVARRTFSPSELEAWRALPAAERSDAFYAAWTRKEAYAKGRGEGLGLALDRIETAPGPSGRWRVVEGGRSAAPAWTVADLDLGAGYAGAVAAEGEDWRLIVRELPTAPG
jgi:4'-phosphopantetheinyl transferase